MPSKPRGSVVGSDESEASLSPPSTLHATQRAIPPSGLMQEGAVPNFEVVRCSANCLHNHDAMPVDGMGHDCHYKCTAPGCRFESHCRTRNHYQHHRRECEVRVKREQATAVQVALTSNKEAEIYATRTVPCMHALMNIPSRQFLTFVRSFLEQWPSNFTIQQFLTFFPKKTGKLHEYESVLADELWDILKTDIDKYLYFGAAIDAGIDRMKGEHILLCVLYIGPKEYSPGIGFPPRLLSTP